jgi:uncharacterized protein YdeI (YjbR/CyaY-like superfamily)
MRCPWSNSGVDAARARAMPKLPAAPIYFSTPEAFREWLNRNAASAAEIIVGFHKVHTRVACISWPQAVDEALCVGWVDGVRHRIDEHRYKIRFTPRKAVSIWSAVNIKRVRLLGAQGRMRPAGIDAFARRKEIKSRIYSYEQPKAADLTPRELKAFKKNKAAWTFFESQAPSYKKRLLWRIVSAKQQATRDRRLRLLIDSSAKGLHL